MGINLFGPVNHTGMGVQFCEWAAAAVPLLRGPYGGVSVVPIDLHHLKGEEPQASIAALASRWSETFDPRGTSLCLWHPGDTAKFAGRVRIFSTVWETDPQPERILRSLGHVDGLIVPSQWHLESIAASGYPADRVRVVPEGINPQVYFFTPCGEAWEHQIWDDEVRFASVSKIERRKGMEPLLEALRSIPDDVLRPVHVVAHWHNAHMPDWANVAVGLIKSRGGMELRAQEGGWVQFARGKTAISLWLGPFLPRSAVVRIYRTCHYGLFPFYAEGWGLPVQEAGACGLPLICQRYSGPTQYLPEAGDGSNGLLPLEGTMQVAKDQYFFDGTSGSWSVTKVGGLRDAVLHAAGVPEPTRLAMGRAISGHVGRWTWDNAANAGVRALSELELSQ